MQATELSQISANLLGKIRELHLQQRPHGFPTERPTTTITDQDLLGPITFWGQEASGEDAFMFIRHERQSLWADGERLWRPGWSDRRCFEIGVELAPA